MQEEREGAKKRQRGKQRPVPGDKSDGEGERETRGEQRRSFKREHSKFAQGVLLGLQLRAYPVRSGQYRCLKANFPPFGLL